MRLFLSLPSKGVPTSTFFLPFVVTPNTFYLILFSAGFSEIHPKHNKNGMRLICLAKKKKKIIWYPSVGKTIARV